ncbi:KAP family P-loop NTPase fold protein [Mycobacterium sp. NPDC003449]
MTSENEASAPNTSYPLWSDEPTARDLLSFDAVAATVVDAVLDDKLDPIALGLSGSWGSGKTSVLELVNAQLEARNANAEDGHILVISTQPWRYDPAVGPKESLIAEVLDALGGEIKPGTGEKAKDILGKLVGRVNWSKAFKIAAKAGVALQLPSIDDLLGLIKEDPGNVESPDRGLAGFREDFASLLASDELKHISRTVVLVDDLDRCLPETVVETLEAIRLFLSTEGMSFVIAADEDRVADAIQQRLGTSGEGANGVESPARLYLHKIVQTTVPLPALSQFDTNAYLFLLLAERDIQPDVFDKLVDSSASLRLQSGSLDELEIPSEVDVTSQLATASRLTPMLYEKFRGNPRRIKRFLNDLHVRQSVAQRRGITLSSDAVAKLMMLERLLPDDFAVVLEWLATNRLRNKLEALEKLANEPDIPTEEQTTDEVPDQGSAKGKSAQKIDSPPVEPTGDTDFSDTLQRWAKLPPRLSDADVSSYLVLAASFEGKQLINEGLPERLRDVASALISSTKVDRDGVTDDNLKALNVTDARTLITHLGGLTRDQPSIQRYSVAGMLRLARNHPGNEDVVIAALKLLPAADVTVPSVMLLNPESSEYEAVLSTWDASNTSQQVRQAITAVRSGWSGSSGN